MTHYYTGEMCTDCTLYIANGDIPEERPELPNEILHLWPDDKYHLHVGTNEEQWFSWQSCDCCGSKLGGDRNQLIVLV